MVNEFLALTTPCLDVRSPCEYVHARLPGAISFPLFSDEERHRVGITYKQLGQQQAIWLGVSLVAPKLEGFVAQLRQLGREVRVYCWRGGMRSGFVGWFCGFTGFPAVVLKGGYKAFRRHALGLLEQRYCFRVLGGLTGSGKTERLLALREAGEQVIDLEGLANHRGSAFGAMGPQPSSEQFENELALQLRALDRSRPIWIEDESRLVGSCRIPGAIFAQMQEAPYEELVVPLEERVERIVAGYGGQGTKLLVACTHKITKRLGGQRTKEVIASIESGDLHQATRMLLEYYDKSYSMSSVARAAAR